MESLTLWGHWPCHPQIRQLCPWQILLLIMPAQAQLMLDIIVLLLGQLRWGPFSPLHEASGTQAMMVWYLSVYLIVSRWKSFTPLFVHLHSNILFLYSSGLALTCTPEALPLSHHNATCILEFSAGIGIQQAFGFAGSRIWR